MERMSILDNYYGEGKSIRDKITELEEENKKLKKEKGEIRQRLVKLEKAQAELSRVKENKELREENKKLKEFKTKREESMFYFKAQMERAEPKTASEAEDLQRAKEIFEKLYRGELSCLEEENKNLNEKVRFLEECLDNKEKVNKSLREELSAYDREYFDEDKKAKNIFMEEDTLQELRDLGKI